MRQLLVLLAVAIVASAEYNTIDLKVKWGCCLSSGDEYFLDMPQLEADAVSAGWVAAERNSGSHLSTLKLYCPSDDPSICFMYDVNGFVSGYQINMEVAKMTDVPIPLENLGFTIWTYNSTTYYSNEMFLIDEDIEEDISSGQILRRGAVWARGYSGADFIEIPLTPADILANTVFTEQACTPTMGYHLYYNMTEDTDCSQQLPWFVLHEDDQVIGLGFTVFGTYAEPADGVVEKFERSSKIAVEAIVPYAPQCVYDWADSPGRTTMHVYFVEDPGSAGLNADCVANIGLFL